MDLFLDEAEQIWENIFLTLPSPPIIKYFILWHQHALLHCHHTSTMSTKNPNIPSVCVSTTLYPRFPFTAMLIVPLPAAPTLLLLHHSAACIFCFDGIILHGAMITHLLLSGFVQIALIIYCSLFNFSVVSLKKLVNELTMGIEASPHFLL